MKYHVKETKGNKQGGDSNAILIEFHGLIPPPFCLPAVNL